MGISLSVAMINQDSYDAALRSDYSNVRIEKSVGDYDLGKLWHAISYLITGDSSEAFLGRAHYFMKDQDLVSVNSPEEVCIAKSKLGDKTLEEIMKLYDPVRLNELNVYFGSWREEHRRHIEQELQGFLIYIGSACSNGYGFINIKY